MIVEVVHTITRFNYNSIVSEMKFLSYNSSGSYAQSDRMQKKKVSFLVFMFIVKYTNSPNLYPPHPLD